MLAKIESFLRQARFTISSNQWLVRVLGLSSQATEQRADGDRKGLLLIQIDGLSRRQLERAMANNYMPFLSSLLAKDGYHLESLYSGLPSSTPAVQGELFYGVKGCVPAFSFKRHRDRKVVMMVEPEAAGEIEESLVEQGGQPLLEGGSCYSDIFSGGAAETSFCAASVGWSNMMPTNHFGKMLFFAFIKIPNIVRAAALAVIEVGVAVVDLVLGVVAGKDFVQELKFVPMRVAASVILREMVETGVSLDVTRGLPVVHANFIGFDEQSHRRGPESKFAHWSLRGIDRALHRIWNTAKRCPYRDYDVWFYSDHGQENVVPFSKISGASIQQRVNEYFGVLLGSSEYKQNQAIESSSADWKTSLRGRWLGWPPPTSQNNTVNADTPRVEVIAMGPVGFVYLPQDPPLYRSEARLAAFAQLISEREPTLMVAVPNRRSNSKMVSVFSEGNEYMLPADSEAVFGANHPFFTEICDDFMSLVNHADSGDLVITGWSGIGKASMSLRVENGSHAGPGEQETHAFALLPGDIPIGSQSTSFIRPMNLRQTALEFLGYSQDRPQSKQVSVGGVFPHRALKPLPLSKNADHKHCLRVLTYNIHSCIGTDGQLSTARIARVIANYQPDVVCLQEVDVDFNKTNQIDQAKLIAVELSMDISFHPVRFLEKGRFGNAILSDFPMRRVNSELLFSPQKSKLMRKPFNEARGGLWVELNFNGQKVNIITTHLGLTPNERKLHVDKLLGEQWLASPECAGPVVLCGDFNASRKSTTIRRLETHLKNVHDELPVPLKTFPSAAPTTHIDHIFVCGECRVKNVQVGSYHLAKIASDHLPLIADIELPV